MIHKFTFIVKKWIDSVAMGQETLVSQGRARLSAVLQRAGKLVLSPALQPVYHPYSDELEGGIQALCYVYEEVFGEKLRALAERIRLRDLYDVVNLFRNSTIKPAAGVLFDILRQKCEFKGISVPVLADLESHKESLEGSWANMLGHRLPNLPPEVHAYMNAESDTPSHSGFMVHFQNKMEGKAQEMPPSEPVQTEHAAASAAVLNPLGQT